MPVAGAGADVVTIRGVEWLHGKCRNVHSQSGEDGLIEAIFEHIGTTNKWCFEVGAYDGYSYSNVANLIKQGWHAVLVEQDAEAFGVCAKNYVARTDVRCLNTYVYPWTFEAVLQNAGLPMDPDLGSIDIDEQDFWLWAGMQTIRPRVMVVEFGLGRPVDQVPPLVGYKKDAVPQIQAGENMIVHLGIAKSYTPVVITQTNVLFIRNDCLTQQELEQCRQPQQ